MNRLLARAQPHFYPSHTASTSSQPTAAVAAVAATALSAAPLRYPTAPPPRPRRYATQPPRRAVTPFNDDGRVPWAHLSPGEKTARAAQQTFNFGVVVVGVALTGGVGYLLYQEVFSPDSKTAYFNRAVDRIKKDARCTALLGEGRQITAYGEETFNKWRRARPIASTLTRDRQGNDHLMIHFNVRGPKGAGVVQMHLIKRAGQADFGYKYFFVDVPGHPRVYLENADASAAAKGGEQKGFKLFGVKWA